MKVTINEDPRELTSEEQVLAEAEAARVPTMPKRDFMKLFTNSERRQIIGAAMQNVDIADWQNGLLLADDIRLNHPDLIAGMAEMVTAGLLTEARKAAILAGEAST